MGSNSDHKATVLSVVIPCFNECATLKACVEQVLQIADENLSLEIIIVDDASTDDNHSIMHDLKTSNNEIRVKSSVSNYTLEASWIMIMPACQTSDLEIAR